MSQAFLIFEISWVNTHEISKIEDFCKKAWDICKFSFFCVIIGSARISLRVRGVTGDKIAKNGDFLL